MKTFRTKLLRALAMTWALCIAATVGGAMKASAGEIIPSVGLSRPVHSESNETTLNGGVAFRGSISPALKAEIGVMYRKEEVNDLLTIHQWPLTASMWLTPIPALYAGGGVGWYHNSFHYDEPLDFQNETDSQFGVHLGGGLKIPMTPNLGLDLNGRYVFLDEVETKLSTEKFDPDFWTTTLGLAIHF